MSLFAQLRKGCHLGPISDLPLEIRQIIFGHTISPFKRPEDVGLGYIADPFITQDFLALCKDFNQSIKILQSYTEENTGAEWLTSVREKWRREWETCMSEMLEEDKEVWYRWYYLGVSGDRPGWSLYKHFKMIVEQMRIGLAYSAMRTPEMCAATELYEMRTGEVYMHQSYVNDPLRFRDEAVLKALDSVRYARLEMISGISRTRQPIGEMLVRGADKRKAEDRILQLRVLESNCQTRKLNEIGLRSKLPWSESSW